MSRSALVAVLLALVNCFPALARGEETKPVNITTSAQGTVVPSTEKPAAKPEVNPELARRLATPRRTLETLINCVNQSDLDTAAQTLRLGDAIVGEARERKGRSLAARLKTVIDRMWDVDFDTLPNNPDQSEPFVFGEHLLTVSGDSQVGGKRLEGKDLQAAHRIVISRDADGLWRFTNKTVDSVEELYHNWMNRDPVTDEVHTKNSAIVDVDSWFASLFPKELRRSHFLLPTYRWFYLLGVIFLGFVADLLTRSLLRSLTSAWFRLRRKPGDESSKDIRPWRPVGLLVQATIWYWGVSLINLPDVVMTVMVVALKLFAVVASI